MVAMVTTLLVSWFSTYTEIFKKKLVSNSFSIFSAENYPQAACFGKVMPQKYTGPVFFWDTV